MRSHRCTRQLAMQLAAKGFNTLRFDYFGTGDSEGNSLDSSVNQWQTDIGLAARELQDASGCNRIALFGIRTGALLAQQAWQSKQVQAQALISWDAPASGHDFMQLMRFHDQASDGHKNARRTRDAKLPSHADYELCGHAWHAKLAEGIEALPGLSPHKQQWVIQSSDCTSPVPAGATLLTATEPGRWQLTRWRSTPWLPSRDIGEITHALAQGLS